MDSRTFKQYQIAFANNLKILIESRGITPKEFAIETGIPDATVYRYLGLSRVPKMDNIIVVAQYFNVSIDWLLGNSDDKAETWPAATLNVAKRYSIASPDDRRVVDTVLEKYGGADDVL